MAVRELTREEREKATTMTAASSLRHPLRVRILEVVNEQDMSPSRFFEGGLAPPELAPALSNVSYHFRELLKFGCVKVVATFQRRGATEHVYRGLARAFFSDDEWAKLDKCQRQGLSKVMLSGMIARADGAIMAGTFDSRLDRHLTWVAMQLDERGWAEMMTTLAGAFADTEAIRQSAAKRLEDSGQTPIPATVGILGFPSPPAPEANEENTEV
jgi:hypothetical protein